VSGGRGEEHITGKTGGTLLQHGRNARCGRRRRYAAFSVTARTLRQARLPETLISGRRWASIKTGNFSPGRQQHQQAGRRGKEGGRRRRSRWAIGGRRTCQTSSMDTLPCTWRAATYAMTFCHEIPPPPSSGQSATWKKACSHRPVPLSPLHYLTSCFVSISVHVMAEAHSSASLLLLPEKQPLPFPWLLSAYPPHSRCIRACL